MTAAKWVERPGEVRVGNHLYTIEWLTSDEWDAARYPDEAAACTLGDLNLIAVKLKANTPESVYQELVFHEVTHAAWNATMLTHAPLEGIEDLEEFVIGAQSPALLGILQLNPHLYKYLISDGTVVR